MNRSAKEMQAGASPSARRAALVVEGGGMRGGFSAGVLDVFLEVGFNPFSIYGGASGGAMNLSSFLSGQHGRNLRIYRDICTKPEFISVFRFLRGGHLIDLDWLWQQMAQHEPFDVQRAYLNTRGKQVYFAATDVGRGEAAYFTPDTESWMDILKASSALPLLYRRFIRHGGFDYTDGGVCDPLPFMRARALGADTVLVIRSRPAEYRIRSSWDGKLASLRFWRHPRLRSALMGHARTYNAQAEQLQLRDADGSLMMIAPRGGTQSGRTAVTRASIEQDYNSGRAAALEFLEQCKGPKF